MLPLYIRALNQYRINTYITIYLLSLSNYYVNVYFYGVELTTNITRNEKEMFVLLSCFCNLLESDIYQGNLLTINCQWNVNILAINCQ